MQKSIIYSIAFFLFFSSLTPIQAQRYPLDNRRDYTWLFGYGNTPPLNSIFTMQFDDNGGFTSSYAGRNYQIAEGSSIISDINGQLDFFTNGNIVCNRTYQRTPGNILMRNRSPIVFPEETGVKTRQSNIILPWPDNPDKHFIIYTHVDYSDPPIHNEYFWSPWLMYAEWDRRLDNGRGNLVFFDSLLLTDTLMAGHIAACRHANGRDWWLIVMREHSDLVHRLLLDPNGIHYLGTQQTTARRKNIGLGSTRFSPDGTRLVQTGTWDFTESYFATYDFDRCSGYLSNCRDTFWMDTLARGGISVGGDWSPDGNYYYMSTGWRLQQLNMNDIDPLDSRVVVETWDGARSPTNNGNPNPVFGGGCRAPDGKLYFDAVNTEYLHVIDYPNEAGAACGVRQRGITMPCWNSLFIPYFPNFRLGPLDGSGCDTLGIDVVSGTTSPTPPKEGLMVYPNPTSGMVRVAWEGISGEVMVILYDQLGRVLLRKSVAFEEEMTELNLQQFADGLYEVVLYQDGKVLERSKLSKLTD